MILGKIKSLLILNKKYCQLFSCVFIIKNKSSNTLIWINKIICVEWNHANLPHAFWIDHPPLYLKFGMKLCFAFFTNCKSVFIQKLNNIIKLQTPEVSFLTLVRVIRKKIGRASHYAKLKEKVWGYLNNFKIN